MIKKRGSGLQGHYTHNLHLNRTTSMVYGNLAKHWIDLQHLLRHKQNVPQDVRETDLMMWPAFEVMELSDKNPSECMNFILEVLKQTNDEWVLANLAAGPLESMLARHPEKGIALIEDEIIHNPKLRHILQDVWQNLMPEETWQRLQKLRD